MSDLYDALTTVRDVLCDLASRIQCLEDKIDAMAQPEEGFSLDEAIQNKIREIAREVADEAIEDVDWASKVYDEVSTMSFSVSLD